MKNLFIVCFLFLCSVASAQDANFSNSTLQNFANAYSEIRVENEQMQLNLMTEIEKVGLTNEEFTSIHKQLNDSATNSEVSNDDKVKYETALRNIKKFEQSSQKVFENIITQNGLTLETYQAISKACMADNTLKKQVMDMIN
jgi:hypothetical protein